MAKAENPSGRKETSPIQAKMDGISFVSPIRTSLAVTVFTAIIFTTYEATKQLVVPQITIWQSSIVTIIFAMMLAMAISYYIFNKVKDSEQRFREGELKYRALVENSPNFIGILQDGVLKYVNNVAVLDLGWTKEELLSSTFDPIEKIVSEKFRSVLKENIAKRLHGERIEPYEISLVRKNGSRISVAVRAAKIIYNSKPAIEFVFDDISVRKLMEERYHTIFDQMLDGMYLAHEGRFIDVNPAFVKMFGYSSKQELLNIEDVKKELYFPNGERGNRILETDQVKLFRMRKKDGSEIWVEDHVHHVRDELGNVAYHEGIVRDVTERKRFVEGLRDLALLPSEDPNPVLRLDNHGIILLANKASNTLLLEWGSGIGKPVPKLWHDLVTTALSTGQSRDFDIELLGKSYTFLVKPIMEAGYVNLYGRDITERKLTEQANTRLAAIVESSDDAIIGKSLDGSIQNWNKGAEKTYGYTAKEVEGKSISILIPPHRPDDITQILNRVAKGETIRNFETERLRRDGQIINVSLTVSPIKDEDDRIVGASTIARDITERRRIEMELRQSEAKFRKLAERSIDAIAILNTEGRITYISPAAERIFRYTPEEMIGKPIQNFHPDYEIQKLSRLFAETLEAGHVEGVTLETFRKDGSHGYIEVNGSTAYDDGKPALVEYILRDITEHQRMEYRLRFLHEHALRLASAVGIDDIVKHTLDAMEFGLGFDWADIQFVEDGWLRLKGVRGIERAYTHLRLDGPGLTVLAANSRKTVRVLDTRKEPCYVDRRGAGWRGMPTALSELAVPIIVEHEVVAVLNIESARPDDITEDDETLLETLAAHVASTITRLRHEDKLRRYTEDLEELVKKRSAELVGSSLPLPL